ncbi:MAG: hypothetical protein ACRBBP_01120 [Bdellovibrionales bacterium]
MAVIIRRISLVVFALFIVSCSEQGLLGGVDSPEEKLQKEMIETEIAESRNVLDQVLKKKRVELLNTHRKQITSFSGDDDSREALRSELKVVRVIVHDEHTRIMKEYDGTSKGRLDRLARGFLLSSM